MSSSGLAAASAASSTARSSRPRSASSRARCPRQSARSPSPVRGPGRGLARLQAGRRGIEIPRPQCDRPASRQRLHLHGGPAREPVPGKLVRQRLRRAGRRRRRIQVSAAPGTGPARSAPRRAGREFRLRRAAAQAGFPRRSGRPGSCPPANGRNRSPRPRAAAAGRSTPGGAACGRTRRAAVRCPVARSAGPRRAHREPSGPRAASRPPPPHDGLHPGGHRCAGTIGRPAGAGPASGRDRRAAA